MRANFQSLIRVTTSALALALALPVIAWTSRREQLTLKPESRLWVEGTSTIRGFSCKAGEVNAAIEGAPDAVAQVAAGEKAIHTIRVIVPAAQLDCGNGTMNEHMRKAIKADDNPTIEFTLSGYDVSRAADGVNGTLAGTLLLGGVRKSVTIPAEGKSEGGVLHVTGAYELKMTDYDLTPPSLMFGRIKVRDVVTVKFDLLLKS